MLYCLMIEAAVFNFSDLNMVNGSWTQGHIVQLWNRAERTHVVYPPVDVVTFKSLINLSEQVLMQQRQLRILSIAQFRPEKNHDLQLEMLTVLKKQKMMNEIDIRLIMIGGCRNNADRSFACCLCIVSNTYKYNNVCNISDYEQNN